jgi:IS5 family transposase
MEQVVPWAALLERIAPYYPEGRTGRPPFSLQTMLRVYFMPQWFTLSDPAMEEAFFDTPLYREFEQLRSSPACPTNPPSCAFAIGWRSKNWLSKSS